MMMSYHPYQKHQGVKKGKSKRKIQFQLFRMEFFKLFLMLIIGFLLILTTFSRTSFIDAAPAAPPTIDDIRDDDCLGIAMRPLPRFGKRALIDGEQLPENYSRIRRACIINRRQSKSDPDLTPSSSLQHDNEIHDDQHQSQLIIPFLTGQNTNHKQNNNNSPDLMKVILERQKQKQLRDKLNLITRLYLNSIANQNYWNNQDLDQN